MSVTDEVCVSLAERRTERMVRVVRALVADSRKPLSALSRELGIPVSTLFDYLRVVRKHCCFTLAAKDTVGAAWLMLLREQAAQPAQEQKNEPQEVGAHGSV